MSRIDNLKKQHPDLDVSLMDIIISVDPTKTYKYSDFLVRMIKKIIKPEEVVKIIAEGMFGDDRIELLGQFERHCQANRIGNPDISKYTSFEDIKDAVEFADEIVKQKELEKQIVKLHEDSTWLVLIPMSFESSKVYGANTKWCTTQETHWNSYFPNYKLIYIINKIRNVKYAISRHYEQDSNVKAWLSDDKETSPLMIPLPPEIMTKVIDEVRKNKDELDTSRLGEDYIYTENGMIIPIKDAPLIALKQFIKRFGKKIPMKMIDKIEARIDEIEKEINEKKSNNIDWKEMLKPYGLMEKSRYYGDTDYLSDLLNNYR